MIQGLEQFGLTGQLEKLPSNRSVEINTVIGFSNAELLPARYFLGILVACSLAEAVQEVNPSISPNVRIILPIHIAAFINGVEHKHISKQREIVEKGTKAIQQMFPTVTIVLDEDGPITQDVIELLKQNADGISNTDEALLESLRESGQKWGGRRGRENALLYVGQHPFAWRDMFDSRVFRLHSQDITINLLPPSEERFSLLRRKLQLRRGVPSLTQLQEVTLGTCDIPNYLPIHITEPRLLSRLPLWQVAMFYTALGHTDSEVYVGKRHNAQFRKAARDFTILIKLLVAKKGEEVTDMNLQEVFGL